LVKCRELYDALLLSDPRNRNETSPELIYVYTANDFDNIRGKFERISGFAFDFRWILTNHPANRNNELYERLCQEPEISEILNRPAQQG